MSDQKFLQNAHYYLGVTRKEFTRRLQAGQVDLRVLKSQIEQNSRDLELEVLCELRMTQNSLEQVDKFEESPL
jgi:hypothetical protein